MLPELFRIGPIHIRAYGLMLAISFVVGVWYVRHMALKAGKPFEPYLNIASLMIIAGVVGARLSYVLLHLEEFSGRWLDVFGSFSSGQFGIAGLNLYGGVLGAILAVGIYCRWKKIDIVEALDYFAPTLGIGLAFTRIGCFMNGCCFGVPTDLPWGVSFPPDSIPHSVFGDLHLHPSQLYSSLYGALLFVLLHRMLSRRSFRGQVVAVLFMAEAVFRFAIEFVRFYEDAMIIPLGGAQITFNQIVSVGLFAAGVVIYLRGKRRTAVNAIATPAHINE